MSEESSAFHAQIPVRQAVHIQVAAFESVFVTSNCYRCLSMIGRRHAMFIPSLVTELLNVHPLFQTPEQNIEDDYCAWLEILTP